MISEVRKKAEKRSTEVIIFAVILAAGTAATTYNNTNLLDAGTSTSNGLVAEYRFDTGAGNTAYDTARNNDGTINGAKWIEGIQGKALKFDGNDDISVVHDNSLIFSDKLTISGWVKPRNPSSSSNVDENKLLFKSETFNFQPGGPNNLDNELRFELNIGGDWKACVAENVVDYGQWQYFALRYDGNHMRIYKNGRELKSCPQTGEITNSQNSMYVSLPGQPFHGRVDRLKIYSINLSKSKIRSIYNSGSWRLGTTTKEDDPSKVLDISFQHQNRSHAYDTSGYENHGTRENGVGQASSVDCKVGRCYSFDGNDDYVDVEESPGSFSDSVTVTGWLNPDRIQGDNRQWLVEEDDGFMSYIGGGNSKLYFRLTADQSQTTWNSGYTVKADEWQHIGLVYDGTTMRAYVDGSLVGTRSKTGDLQSIQNLKIGADALDSGDFYNGKIDQVKIFNHSLTQQEIVEKTQGLDSSGAVLDLRFNQDGGNLAEDSSGSGNEGRIISGGGSRPERVGSVDGNAIELGGDGDAVDIPSSTSIEEALSGEEATIAFWVDLGEISGSFNTWFPWTATNNQGSQSARLEHEGNGDNIYTRWIVDPASAGFREGDGGAWSRGLPDMRGKRFLHVSTFETTESGYSVKTYINDEIASESTSSEKAVLAEASNVGSFSPSQVPSTIDNLQIYPYALTPDKVEELHNKGTSSVGDTGGTREGLVLSQTFNRIETCGQSDTITCPSGASGEIAVDESGEANHGELVNGPSVKDAEYCRVGGCLGFDGSDDYVQIDQSSNINITGEITVSHWVKPRNIPSSGDERMWAKAGGTSGTAVAYQSYFRDGNPRFEYYADGNWRGVTGSSVNENEWVHLAYTYDGNEIRLYKDGGLDGTKTESVGIETNENPLNIGFDTRKSYYFNGVIDQMRIYNRSLSKHEVWKLYTQGRDRENGMAGAAGRWDFSSEYGNNIYDRSGEGNSGLRASNGPATEDRFVVNDDHANNRDLSVVSYEDDTEVTAGTCSKTFDEGITKTFSSNCYSVGDKVISDKGFSAHFTQTGSDGPVPASFAGKEFVYEDCRDPEYFNIIAPYNEAKVTIENASETVVSTTIDTGGHKEINTDMPRGTEYVIESDNEILITYSRFESGGDVYMMHPASDNLWGLMEDLMVSKNNTRIKVYDSDGNKVVDNTFDRYDHIGLTQSGAQGGSEAHHAVANKDALGGSRCADADDGETDIAISNNEMSKEFRLPEPVEGIDGDEFGDYYLSLTTSEAATCSVYYPNGTLAGQKESKRNPPYPGFMTFDTSNDFNITDEGARVSCTKPTALQWEPSDNQGESNLYGIETRPSYEGDNYLEFDGRDDFTRVKQNFDSENITFTARVKSKDYSNGWILNKFANKGDGWGLKASSGGILIYDDIDGVDKTYYQTDLDESWHHIAISMEEEENYLYIDGKRVDSGEISSSDLSSFSGNLYMAQRGTGAAYFSGKIDDVRIYPYSLSQEQVKQVKNGGVISVG